jgi:hypothetical protein
MNKSIWLLFLSLISSATAVAQNQPSDTCILGTAKDGQTITVQGKAVQQPHDLGFRIVGCDDLVIVTYAGDRDTDVPADHLRRDENLKRFQEYTSAVYKSTKKDICVQCMQYGDVEATLTGKLEIATIPPGTTKDQMGFLHDASGKVVGTSGFGHPTRMFKYRLVVVSVADAKARKLPKPEPSNQPSSLLHESEHAQGVQGAGGPDVMRSGKMGCPTRRFYVWDFWLFLESHTGRNLSHQTRKFPPTPSIPSTSVRPVRMILSL